MGRQVKAFVVALFAVILLAGCTSAASNGGDNEFRFQEAQPKGMVIPQGDRRTAPAIDGELLDGKTYDIPALKGKIVVLNFWAEWCAPCRVESPELQTVYDKYKADNVQLVGVAVRGNRDSASAYVEDYKLTYPSLFDPRSQIATEIRGYPAAAIPSTLVIDASGRVAAVYTGAVTKSDLTNTLDKLLAEK